MSSPVKKPEEEEKKVYTYDDLIKFESRDIYNSIGKSNYSSKIFEAYLSTRPSAPQYSFGTQDRQKWGKIFQSKEMAKVDFAGQSSPGPAYNVRGTEKHTQNQPPQLKFNREPRHSLGFAKFDYYKRKDMDFEPAQADVSRRTNNPVARIGLEQRFSLEKTSRLVPGPQYTPGVRPEVFQKLIYSAKLQQQPKYSFGYRRDLPGASPLARQGGTPIIVGPGSYIQGEMPSTSMIEKQPKWSFTKGPKFAIFNNGWDKNQTYDTRSQSLGAQINSKKNSQPAYSIGKAEKDTVQGYFKDLMVKVPQRLQIKIPS